MTDSSVAIQFKQASKRYRIGASRGSLRDAVMAVPGRLRRHSGTESTPYHWALRDVSFDVRRGEALGLIGRNGAGKTTTLKLLSRITRPTLGQVTLAGRVSALIELGAGFHPDLTGRENVFLNGVILGLSRRDIEARYDQIVEFAELSDFMETPVKRYSSGMYARLGFAVAAHADPDILLVDEVLAVGDSNFQQKCLDFLHTFVNSGRTTVFVSHNLYAAEQLCHRLIWLDQGRIHATGLPGPVIEKYLGFMEERATTQVEVPVANRDGALRIDGLRLFDASGAERQVFTAGEDVVVQIEYAATMPVPRPHFCIWVSDGMAPQPIFAANMIVDGQAPEYLAGRGVVRCLFRKPPLMPRTYYVWLEVYGEDRAEVLFQWQRLGAFRIFDPDLLRDSGLSKGVVRFVKSHGAVRLPYEWQLPDTQEGHTL